MLDSINTTSVHMPIHIFLHTDIPGIGISNSPSETYKANHAHLGFENADIQGLFCILHQEWR